MSLYKQRFSRTTTYTGGVRAGSGVLDSALRVTGKGVVKTSECLVCCVESLSRLRNIPTAEKKHIVGKKF